MPRGVEAHLHIILYKEMAYTGKNNTAHMLYANGTFIGLINFSSLANGEVY